MTVIDWPCSAIAISPSAMGTSSCNGELVLTMQVNAGRSARPSTVVPTAIAIISTASTAWSRPMVQGTQVLSSRVHWA